MSLLVVGLSHRSSPVSVLERAALESSLRGKLLHDTVSAEPAVEAVVLSTCNRLELYADVDKFHAGVAELSTMLARHSGVSLEELTPYLYVHYEDRAVHHLFSVACGLDSMVVGEGQILGQIKDALAVAQDEHTAGRLLNGLFQQALRVGKRAHTETGIDRAGQSLVTFGLETLAGLAAPAEPTDVSDWVAGKRALVIGAGSMSSLAATTLARCGATELVIANRTVSRAQRLAASLTDDFGPAGGASNGGADTAPGSGRSATMLRTGSVQTSADHVEGSDDAAACRDDPAGAAATVRQRDGRREADDTPGGAAPVGAGFVARAVTNQEIGAELPYADVVVSCTGATGLVLTAEDVSEALATREAGSVGPDLPRTDGWPGTGAAADGGSASGGKHTVGLLDLAMPRDIDAGVHRLDGVRLVDIESLAEAAPDAPMAADVDAARGIVAEEVAAFGAAQRAAVITPTVVALRAMASDVVAAEMARLDGRLQGLDDKQRAEITQTVRRVVDKLLHAPTVRVKQLAGEPGGAGYAEALRELFDLDPQAVAAVSNPEQERQ